MVRARMAADGTRLGDRGNRALDVDVVRLLKTQDAGYLRLQAQKARNELAALQQELHLGSSGGGGGNSAGTGGGNRGNKGARSSANGQKQLQPPRSTGTHTVFVDTKEQQRAFVPEQWFGTTRAGLYQTHNRPRVGDVDADSPRRQRHLRPGDGAGDGSADADDDHDHDGADADADTGADVDVAGVDGTKKRRGRDRRGGRSSAAAGRGGNEGGAGGSKVDASVVQGGSTARAKAVERWQTRLEACRARLAQLEKAEQQLSLQRDRMAKTPTVGGVNKRGVKWRVRERKR
jgi:U3 small nucleolar RNA-associated protein 11